MHLAKLSYHIRASLAVPCAACSQAQDVRTRQNMACNPEQPLKTTFHSELHASSFSQRDLPTGEVPRQLPANSSGPDSADSKQLPLMASTAQHTCCYKTYMTAAN